MSTFLFGYQISDQGLRAVTEKALNFITLGGRGRYLACANPHSLVVAAKDPVFERALKEADILLPDGSGIILAGKILHLAIKEKVAGFDFFHDFSQEANKKSGIRYFFLGSSEKVLNLMVNRLGKEFPNIVVCGTYSPPFKAEFDANDDNAMIEAVNAAKPDVLWVGMTAPKQEKWIYENRARLNVPFIGAIGAVFDFYAGTKKRSSEFWVKIGLEWLPRFLKEPARLWERNLKSTPIFLWWLVREKIRQLLKGAYLRGT